MRVLSLFSGGGLGDFGLELAGMKIVGQVENNDYCQKILKLRWPRVPKWGDIRCFDGKEALKQWGPVDLISGGFPCQPFSVAGKRRGAADDRNLWPEMFRVISEIRPAWVLAENVPGVLGFVESVVLPDLESQGYETLSPLVFPAHALGAPHLRQRVWIIAYATSDGRRLSEIQECTSSHQARIGDDRETSTDTESDLRRASRNERSSSSNGRCSNLADATGDSQRRPRTASGKQSCSVGRRSTQPYQDVANTNREGFSDGRQTRIPKGTQCHSISHASIKRRCGSWWAIEPNMGRVAHGVPHRMDRLKLLGNGQVVQVVKWIGEKIIAYDSTIQRPH